MRQELVKPMVVSLIIVLLCLALFISVGCGRKERELSNGVVILSHELPLGGFRPDSRYAVVRVDALPAINDTFRDALFRVSGMSKWDERYDCNHFAALYIATAQASYAAAAWHSSTQAQTLALAEVWYRRDGGGGHAIVAAFTDQGLIYIEPQTGKQVSLTSNEIANRYFVRW